MKNILLDFTQKHELALYAEVLRDICEVTTRLNLEVLVVGAVARDLLLFHAHRIPIQRGTADLDLAVAVPSWEVFAELKKCLLATGRFTSPGAANHRLRHQRMPIDLVPFGALEDETRQITWPPTGDTVMNLFGFREAMASACQVLLPGGSSVRVISLPALALLKLVAWKDRQYESRGKDALDLELVVSNYLKAGNESRLEDEFAAWLEDDAFDYAVAGARMLGQDIRALLRPDDMGRIATLLREQTDPSSPCRLPAQMAHHDPERSKRLLAGVLEGFTNTF